MRKLSVLVVLITVASSCAIGRAATAGEREQRCRAAIRTLTNPNTVKGSTVYELARQQAVNNCPPEVVAGLLGRED